jgi:hypothetical protein
MYRQRAPTVWFAFVFAVLGGGLLATAHWIAGIVLVVLALACMAANYFDHDDSSGLYPW